MTHVNLVEVLLGLYAGGLILWFLLRTGFGDRVTFVLLMDYLGVWLFAPILLLIPWVVLARSIAGLPVWSLRLTLAAAVPVLLALRYYGAALAPARREEQNPDTSAQAGTFITVLTFNLLYGNDDIDAVVELLLASKADVLALQEIHPDKHIELRKVLHSRYPYHAFNEAGGLGVHSRFPILDEEILPFEPWPAQRLTLEVGSGNGVPGSGVPLHLINAHLAPVGIFPLIQRLDAGPVQRTARLREAQVSTLLERLPACGNGKTHESPTTAPTIIACDCNMTELNSTYAAMTGCLRDAYRERNWGLGHTFIIPRGLNIPSSLNIPAQRLDYLFHSRELIAERVRVIRNPAGSDHLPVLARFRLPSADPASKGNGQLDGTEEMRSRKAA